jgi:hypothetical protein
MDRATLGPWEDGSHWLDKLARASADGTLTRRQTLERFAVALLAISPLAAAAGSARAAHTRATGACEDCYRGVKASFLSWATFRLSTQHAHADALGLLGSLARLTSETRAHAEWALQCDTPCFDPCANCSDYCTPCASLPGQMVCCALPPNADGTSPCCA